MKDTPPILVQQEPRLSTKECEKIVDDILVRLKIHLPKKVRNHEFIVKNKGMENELKKTFYELVLEVREFGCCIFLQGDLDRADFIFGGSFGMGISTPNMDLTVEWAGYKKTMKGPCRNNPSEWELSEDIEFYKFETCVESSNYGFDLTARNYRGYLFSSIALVDSYINRHIYFYNYKGRKSPEFEELKSSTNSERRIELFIKEFCHFSFKELKSRKEWRDYKKLKDLRNEVTHSLYPYMGIEFKEMAKNLNLSILGVGSLLKIFQEGQGRNSLTFIEQIRTSPAIHFNEILTKANGIHKEKRHFNQISR